MLPQFILNAKNNFKSLLKLACLYSLTRSVFTRVFPDIRRVLFAFLEKRTLHKCFYSPGLLLFVLQVEGVTLVIGVVAAFLTVVAVVANQKQVYYKNCLQMYEIEKCNYEEETQQVKEECLTLKRSLAASSAKMLKQNQFLMQVQAELKSIVSAGFHNCHSTQDKITKLEDAIEHYLKSDKRWSDFKDNFDKIHPHFFSRLTKEYPNLTNSELRLCALLRLNCNTKDIAQLLGVSQKSANMARYRLRKKMKVQTDKPLNSFMMGY
ncbi:hypothetical protein [uncultured Microscilla sp.]|uniref:helix-turn-helix transcriptional regulator n=1 Tax=uncultured Microscilla sp. TaxID=432653 RepID=UPI002611FE42|nr:hypothetical protein [uncultured Microscilla sp.]